MKNALTRKIMAAAAALIVVASLAGCAGKPADDVNDSQPTVSASETVSGSETSGADVSGSDVSASDVSGSDVSGSDVSGSDAVVVDDATVANSVIDAYFAAFNSGDAQKLADLTCSPAMVAFLKSNGYSADFVKMNYADSIKEMKAVSGGSFDLRHEYTVAEADTEQMDALKAKLNGLSAGSGDKIQAARVYQVTMKSVEAVSSAGVSASDAFNVLEQSESIMYAYKYDGNWYVFVG